MAMAPAKIMVVDDDAAIRNLLDRFLTKKNYQVECVGDGKTALELFDRFNPDLVILDLNLPDIIGYKLCQQMQSINNVFVLMLTSRADAADKIKGFSLGADDYITKPFDLEELAYRVQAILKRQRFIGNSKPNLIFDKLVIDPLRREVKLNNQVVFLTALEFDLLYFLARHPYRVWRRSELIEKVWDYSEVVETRVVDVHIGQIRKKIEIDQKQPSWIQTVRGVGYKFDFPKISSPKENTSN